MKQDTRFMYRSAKAPDRLLIEAVLPGGSIAHVFRNVESRAIVLQGSMDRVKWTIKTASDQQDRSPIDEVLEIRVPLGYEIADMGIIEKFEKGRVLLSFPTS